MRVPPLLAKLDLNEVKLAALRRQGRVYGERRKKTTKVFRLRFRVDGRLCTIYIGTNEKEARQLAAELREWQRCRRHELAGNHLRRQVNQVRRDCNRRLAQVVGTEGYRMHGSAIRKIRKRSCDDHALDDGK
jgi:hypothetical protein